MPDTPLGQIVAIRSEKDAKIIQEFTDSQRKIYDDWHNRKQSNNEQEYIANMDKLFAMLKA